jgi:hypothetical protein
MSQFRSPNKRRNYSQAEKQMIVKVFHEISEDFDDLTKTAQIEKTADYTGCGFRTIQRYLAEEKKCGQLQAPKKPYRKCIQEIEYSREYVSCKIYSYYK